MEDHIVLVDDESIILRVLARQLAPFARAYRLTAFSGGREAVQWLRKIRAQSDRVALIIADQVMPEVTGVELLEAVHRDYPDAAKILLTGHGSVDVIARALNNASLDRYLSKPWEEADLLVTVEMLLSQQRQRQQHEQAIAQLQRELDALHRRCRDLEGRLRLLRE